MAKPKCRCVIAGECVAVCMYVGARVGMGRFKYNRHRPGKNVALRCSKTARMLLLSARGHSLTHSLENNFLSLDQTAAK